MWRSAPEWRSGLSDVRPDPAGLAQPANQPQEDIPVTDPRSQALVPTDWLAAHLADPGLRVIDATFKMPGQTPTSVEEYATAHIPGAVFFDINEIADPDDPRPHMLPSPDRFARLVGSLGIGDEHRLVVYDGAGLMSAARVWWMFRVFGHDRIAILDGGLPKWQAEQRPVTAEVPKLAPAIFKASYAPTLVRAKAQLLRNIETKAEQVVDARAAGRFDGSVEDPWPGRRAGHIPGSRNLPYTNLIDPVSKTVRPTEELRREFGAAGVDLDRPAVASCGSGVTAGVLAFGLHLLGCTEVAVYDGSWAEWGLPGDTPVVTGPAGPR
jgi:thiosulfate/3-mercaptopyruvate sulfurtransferase